MPPKFICIGDPHFRPDNAYETNLLTERAIRLVADEQPARVVVLGDILHTFERIDLQALNRAITFLRGLREAAEFLYVVIGNHDRPNNRTYLTDEHPFNALKDWPKTQVIDTPFFEVIEGQRFAWVPYVEPGRFLEALGTTEGLRAIFAHQEFKGARMGATVSENGDPWPVEAPLCISGHIHEASHRPNLVYVGTPYGEKTSTVSVFIFGPTWSERCVSLRIPYRLTVNLTPTEAIHYEPPENTLLRLRVSGTAEELKQMMKHPHVKHLIAEGVKIRPIIKDTHLAAPVVNRGRISFHERLHRALNAEPEVWALFGKMF